MHTVSASDAPEIAAPLPGVAVKRYGGGRISQLLRPETVCLSRCVQPRIEDFFSLPDQLRQRPHL